MLFAPKATPGMQSSNLVFGDFSDAGFTAICYGALQYDTGSEGSPSPFLIEALRATKLDKSQYTQETDEFTPLEDQYSNSAAGPFTISNFTPHDNACDLDRTCPECQN